MEQDVGKISGLAQTLQSSPDPVPIRCTVPRTSTLSTATALPKQQLACTMLHNAHGTREHTAWQPRPPRCSWKYPLFTARSFD
ncbi:hypothetical protein B0H13DRAFT_2301358 [Mycena leptocephala]|nr:hypothetical protein B0H13DRAFT_2301358 [Mycena leptocephala]